MGWLNLELRDSTGRPLAAREYALRFADGSERLGRLDAAGVLREPIPAGCARATLFVADRAFELELDALPAADDPRGAQERLNHLHYFAGPVDGRLGPRSRAALRRFQRDHGLEVSGELDPATARRLREEHGG